MVIGYGHWALVYDAKENNQHVTFMTFFVS